MNFGRIFSLLIALINIIIALRENLISLGIFPLLGIFFIWFPDFAKQFTNLNLTSGMGRATPLDPNTPSCVFALIGWAILLGPLIFVLVTMFVGS
jgi:hypothetical protein